MCIVTRSSDTDGLLTALSGHSVAVDSFVLTEFHLGSWLRRWGLFAVPAARRIPPGGAESRRAAGTGNPP